MVELYNVIFYKPIFNFLIGLYNVLPGHEIAVAIIILTIVIKLILWPLSQKAMKSQRAMADLQPKVAALKKKYAGDDQKEQLAKELMGLYSKEKVSPMSSCLPILLQLPVFIALFQSLSHGLESSGFDALYPFIADPGTIDPMMFGLLDLAMPSMFLAALAAVTQFFQAKMMVTRQQPKGVPGGKDERMMASMNKQMLYFMPILTLFIGSQLPGGLALYWLTMNGLTILQQKLYFGPDKAKGATEGFHSAGSGSSTAAS